MHKFLKILLIIVIVLAEMALLAFFGLKKLWHNIATAQMAPDNYTSEVKTGSVIEAKYLARGGLETKSLVAEYSDDADIGKITVWYPAELEALSGKYPVVLFVNGTGVGASRFAPVFEHMASWGFADSGRFTSEFPAHMMSHAARLSVDPDNRVIMHCHPDNLLAMTYVHDLDEREFTRTLWQMETECIIVFPEGVNVLPWMLCGTNEIGEATAEKMKTARLVVWAQHGIYGAGRDLDETFGLIETAEKAAEVYLKIAHLPWKQTITDENLHQIAKRFGVKAREGYLD